MVKRQFSRELCLLYSVFSTMHVHLEHCDWLNFCQMTSSGHFAYLSAGRSRLATFIRDQTTKKVSISPSLTHLARHPRPMLGVLALWAVHSGCHPQGCPPQLPAPQISMWCPINTLSFGHRPVLACPHPDSFA